MLKGKTAVVTGSLRHRARHCARSPGRRQRDDQGFGDRPRPSRTHRDRKRIPGQAHYSPADMTKPAKSRT